MSEPEIDMWLDDIRDPSHFGRIGWTWVKTVSEAQALLSAGRVRRASLDHDLGACGDCAQAWRDQAMWADAMPNCEHFGTGYTLVCWMEETGCWPPGGVGVHSANPVGAARMRQVIRRAGADQ